MSPDGHLRSGAARIDFVSRDSARLGESAVLATARATRSLTADEVSDEINHAAPKVCDLREQRAKRIEATVQANKVQRFDGLATQSFAERKVSCTRVMRILKASEGEMSIVEPLYFHLKSFKRFEYSK